MNAQEFAHNWTNEEDRLEPFDHDTVGELNIQETTREFLIGGLPQSAAPFLEFGPSVGAHLQSASDHYDLSDDFACYKIIGFNAYGDPVCLNEDDESIVYLNSDDEFGYVFMNSSVRQLALFLLFFRDFIDLINDAPEESHALLHDEFLAKMRDADNRAMSEGPWVKELGSFME